MNVGGYELHQRGGGVQQGKNRGILQTGIATYTGRLIFQTVASGTPIASTSAPTAFDQQPTIAKGLLNVVGARCIINLWGRYGTTGTPSLQLHVRLDDPTTGDLLAAPATAAAPNNASAWSWDARVGFVVRAIGVGGTLEPASSTLTLANNTSGVAYVNQVIENTITSNTNTNHIVYSVIDWGAASSSNTIVVDGMSIEIDYAFATA